MSFPLSGAEIDAVAQKAERAVDYHLSAVFRREAEVEGLDPERAEVLFGVQFLDAD
jgi:hypothetical protein